jgi:hypothetical protein
MGLGPVLRSRVQFCLILCLLLFAKKKKKNTKNKDKNKEMARDFSQGRHYGCAVSGFP